MKNQNKNESQAYTPAAVKTPLFDRIFKPETITLKNGHSTVRPRSRLPLILVLVLVVFVWALRMTGFDLSVVASRGYEMWNILGKIFQPKWSFFPKVVTPLIDTIKMSIMGTAIGCVLALPFAVLASSNINHLKWLVSVVRFILALIRTLPTLIIALACALIFSLGTFAGTVAIAIFTFGIVAKMLYESIETIDMGPFEAMEALGANKFQAFWSACVPQILPVYLSHCLYCFEMNVRASAILGYVGAGGLGITINERIGWRDYNGLGMVLLTLFVVVLAIEFFSEYLRKKLS
jgi:phosphonate transport system permease protein